MSSRHPLALTPSQLGVVMEGARALPPDQRSKYLGIVADELTARQVDDPAVQDAVQRGLELLLLSPTAA